MNIPEEFGKYLLLKKLGEDSLGETFRAGRAGREGIDQVVLLRVLNGQSLDGERLWQKISGRAAVQQALRSPNIGSGVDLGKVRSYPFVAYDYISGKNLATLLSEAARQRMPIPPDHALLIVERLALALAAAYETRVHDERILHGFVVPHLVMVSNEGEARLLGFEVAPGLRELYAAGWRQQDLLPYLAPEVASGSITRADDVYSLGALLFELLTGHPLAPGSPEQHAALVDSAMAAHDDAPIPTPVAALLKKSLLPRDQRIPDAVTWHKAVSRLMIEGQYSSTTFNLAFFMHNLFRDDIERETQEIAAEKRLELPPTRAAVVAAAPLPPAEPRPEARPEPREVTGVRETTFPGSMAQAAAAGGKNRAPLWAGLAVAGLVVLGVGGYLLFGRGGGKPAPPPSAASAASPTAVADTAKQQANLQVQIQQMIEARSKEMESKFKNQYDDQIKQLQKKLEESKKAAASTTESERPSRSERSATAASSSAATETPRTATREVPTPTPARSEPLPPPPASAVANDASTATTTAQTAADKGTAAPAAAPDPPRAPQVQTGDLVTSGPGVISPKFVSMPDPRFPIAASRMNTQAAAVNLKVLVDERGRVLEASAVGPPAGFGFDEAAVEAARRATYQPATKDGVKVKMWVVLRVAFKNR
jgi:TonB family protein